MIESASMFDVSIDFSQSHLYFPRIIIALLIGMLVVIAIVHRRRVLQVLRDPRGEFRFFEPHADKLRLFASIVLVSAYLYAMDVVGGYFPNQGFGFLFCSMVFVFLLALIFVPSLNRKTLTIISCNAATSPVVVWYVLGNLFGITLP